MKPGRKLEHIAKFLENSEYSYRFQNCSVARNGIQYEVKMLVCEILLSGTGIPVILILEYSRFRSIKLEKLDGLKNAITDANRIKKLAGQKANWIDRCSPRLRW